MRFGIAAARLGLLFAAAGLAAVRARAGRRHLRRRRPARHDPARDRRRHRVQPGAAGGDERRRAEQSGLASGIVNTAFMMGGALGLAVLASLADWRTGDLRASGSSELAALTGGYQLAFVVATVFAVGAAAIGGLLLRPGAAQQHAAHGEVATELGVARPSSSRRPRRSRPGRASPGARSRSQST